jgi:cell volume regulation protein A
LVFLAVSAVIAVGYFAGRFARSTRFPDVALLLVIGLALGPGNRLLRSQGLGSAALADALDPAWLREVAPIVAGLALVVILFEAGLGMEVRQIRSSLGPAVRIALPVFLLTAGAVAAIGVWVFGMPPIVAVVLGVALSNVGQTVSSALLRRMRTDESTRAIGLVEMAIYDVVSVPILVSLFQFAGGGPEEGVMWSEAIRGFAQTTAISLSLGGGAGIVWLLALGRLEGHPHSYVLTLATLLAVYAITEALGGAGAVSVLLFGLIIGNRVSLLRRFGRRFAREGEEAKVQAFHEEVSFFVRTVFFLFLGLSFTIGLQDRWPVASPLQVLEPLRNRAALFGLGAALVLVALPLARAAAIPAVAGRRHREWHDLIPVFGHGLGTAVLATLPFIWHDYQPGTAFHAQFSPWEPVFVNLAFLVILGSVLGSGALVFVSERWPGRAAEASRTAAAETLSPPVARARPTTQVATAKGPRQAPASREPARQRPRKPNA